MTRSTHQHLLVAILHAAILISAPVHASRLVLTCMGKCFRHQPYIFEAIYQARIFNPSTPIDVIVNDPDLLHDTVFNARAEHLDFGIHLYDPSALSGVHKEFKDRFFIKGKMTPDGNQDFNLYTTQRFFALHWYMISQQATDMWHMENDNLLYANLDNLLPPMRACGVGLGVPFTEKMQGVASLIFIKDASSLEPFLHFIVKVFSMSKGEASAFVEEEYVNDMSILAKFFDIHDNINGTVRLPSTNVYKPGENCLWDRYQLLFDAEVVGQWYGGTWAEPDKQQWWPTRIFDPRDLPWTWKDSSYGHKVPYLGEYRLLNMHCHSKRLIYFMSPVNSTFVAHKTRRRKMARAHWI